MHHTSSIAAWRLTLVLAIATATVSVGHSQEVADSSDPFATVVPLLKERCWKCHGERQQKADLRLDSLDGLLTGGVHGPAIVPGGSEDSLLVYAVRREEDLAMPPDGPLDSSEVAALIAWIDAGANWPQMSNTPETAEPVTQALIPFDQSAFDPRVMAAEGKVDFRREVRPILSEHCFECHGPDAAVRQAGLRLDRSESVFADLASGGAAVVAGDLGSSQLFRRVSSNDPQLRMPPGSKGKPLSQEQVETLGRWIAQGAEWSEHWSFIAPVRGDLPEVVGDDWVQNPVDAFVLARLESEGLAPSERADPETLVRRLTLDVTGLPPTPGEIDAFLADRDPGAVGRLIDRLMASDRYGEHLARYWLDAARYADTNGYHIDNEREMWRWRDWVISAFNDNLPYDQFTIEQLAGDLLEEPTSDQLLATGFNRNHMINFEGGAIPEEYLAQYIFDRVDTTSTVWLGLTAGCAKCHDHKFDPLSQREYYGLAAFFNTIDEKGLDGFMGNAAPLLAAPTAEQRAILGPLEAALEPLEEMLDREDDELAAEQLQWQSQVEDELARKWERLEIESARSLGGAELRRLDDDSLLASGVTPGTETYEIRGTTSIPLLSAVRLEALTDPTLPKGSFGRSPAGEFTLSEIEMEITPPGAAIAGHRVVFEHAFSDARGARDAIDGSSDSGWSGWYETGVGQRTAIFVTAEPIPIVSGSRLTVRLRHESTLARRSLGRFRLALSGDPTLELADLGPWSMAGPYAFPVNGEGAAIDQVFPPERGLAVGLDLGATYRDGRRKWVPYLAGTVAENSLQSDAISLSDGVWYLHRTIDSPMERKLRLWVSAANLDLWLNGEIVSSRRPPIDSAGEREIRKASDPQEVVLNLEAGRNELVLKTWSEGESMLEVRRVDEQVGSPDLELEFNLTVRGDQRRPEEDNWLRRHYRRLYWPGWVENEEAYASLREQLDQAETGVPTTMVMSEAAVPRSTYILVRGQYDILGEQVFASTPSFLPAVDGDATANRLALARWLVDPENPLTARVTVNRIWQRIFGIGLVATSDDFGSQGEAPSHPELLDWLATELIRLDWDLKAFQKLLLESATYAQSSDLRADLAVRDPANRLMARASRYRLDGEVLRDSSLYAAGLLVERLGGPSVRPYQPAGLWEEIGYESRGRFSGSVYSQDSGDALYRRSLYTFWKRTVPPPSMLIFDAPNRETCTVLRARTNTPLQALTMLNDPQFVEAARVFAERLLVEETSTDGRLELAFRSVLARRPAVEEKAILGALLDDELERLSRDPADAVAMLEVGESSPAADLDAIEVAAWSVVASVILNLDEAVTRN